MAAMEDGKDDSALLFETVKRIREWVESTFQEDVAKKFDRKGRLKGRFLVKLSDEMWKQLKAYIEASLFFSKLQLTKGESLGQPCIEVLLLPEARELYAQKRPDLAAGAGHAAAAAPAGPGCHQDAASTGKRPGDAVAGREKRVKSSFGQQTTAELLELEELEPYEVGEGKEGLEEARDALKAALRKACEAREKQGRREPREAFEALRWLKGLEQRRVSARELEQTKIGLVVNEWRQVFKQVFDDEPSKERARDLLSSWRRLWQEAKALNFAS